ncbi:MAG TPA: hypothetical protein VN180_04220 [Acidimicrobiia bacterium]|nr:hypothetical protein [Acidimicrobiia bacterium]
MAPGVTLIAPVTTAPPAPPPAACALTELAPARGGLVVGVVVLDDVRVLPLGDVVVVVVVVVLFDAA